MPGIVYLVVGGSGLLGRHIVEKLHDRGDEVVTFDIEQRYHDVPHIAGDIRDKDQVYEACKKSGAQCIFHTASPVAIDPPKDAFSSIIEGGTRHVLAACQQLGIPKLIFTSSSGVVFNGSDISNGDETLPYASPLLDDYMVSKAAIEQELLAAHGMNGVSICILRPSTIFGPGDRNTIAHMYRTYKEGKTHVQFGNNKNLMDWTYVTNVADAHLLAADRLIPDHTPPVAGQIFFITNDEPLPFWDVGRMIWDEMDKYHPGFRHARAPIVIPRFIAQLVALCFEVFAYIMRKKPNFTRFIVSFMCADRWYNIDKAKKTLGYKPEVNMKEGIEKAVAWWMEQVKPEELPS